MTALRYSTKGKSARQFRLVLVLSIFCLLASCRRDDEDDGPIFIPKELYQIQAELYELNEIPCLDSVPSYDPGNINAYDFAFEDSVFIEHIAMNPNNADQWAFSKRYVTADGQYGIGTEAVYWTDLSTGECKLIDSTENLRSLVYGGDFVVLELSGACKLYNVRSGRIEHLEGIHPSISPKGNWLKLYVYEDFSNRREDLFDLSDLSVHKSWQYGGGRAPGRALWIDENSFLYHKSKVSGDTNELKKYTVLDDIETVEYSSTVSTIGGAPIIRLSDHEVLTSGGFLVDLDHKSENWIYRRCKNKYFIDFVNIGKGHKFIGKKVYYRADHEKRVVYYSHHFHLLKPDEGIEQRLKLIFD